jgi:penicillin-binding protein 1A
VAAASVVVVPAVAGLALALIFPQLPEVEGLADYRPKLSMRVTSADGVLLGEFGEERRRFVPIAQIPKVMQDAVLAIEDARFYQHGGVDYLGVIRAGLANFGEAKSQGASTITMQVARNFYLSSEKTFTRKIYEILLALKIERQLSKERILELYMNQIYLGQRAYGFAAAAETYFGKPLEKITVAEAAMLAGLPKAPSAYNPIANPRRATIRQQYIIERMLDGGFITQAQHDTAQREELHYRTPRDVAVHAEYVAETARQLMFSQYGEEAYTRGFNVQLTLNAEDQKAAYQALRRGLMDYERRQVYRGPEAYVDLPSDPKELDLRIAEALNEHPDNDDLRAAVVLEASARKVVAVLQSGESITVTGDGLKPVASGLSDKAAAQKQIRRGAVVRAIKGAKDAWTLTQLPEVEGAFVALDPRDGSIRALVGGFDWRKNKFNHVTQAWRQPGSSFKPFIYSAALEKGLSPGTLVDDAPLSIDSGGSVWEPRNDDGVYDGPTTLRRALAQSKNVVVVRVLQQVGAQEAQQWVTRFGFAADKHPAYPTMALGAGSVTPMQLAGAYAVFANGGHLLTPTLIRRVTDADGHVLFDAAAQAHGDDSSAISERNAFVVSSMLQEVTRSGTAAKVQATLKRSDLYGKTGTTSDAMDAWFAGFQPGLVAVAWIGYDQPRSLGNHEFGATLAVPVWTQFMQQALRDVPVQELAPPAGVRQQDGDWVYDDPLPADAPVEATPP